jgi:glycerol-3-phosphate cytidylyltransferase
LIAGVVSDELLELQKGARPVVPLIERLEIVRNIRCVDEAYAAVLPDKLDIWRELQFDIFFKGDDWQGTEEGERLEREFAKVGVSVVYFPYTRGTSSTARREALANLSRFSASGPWGPAISGIVGRTEPDRAGSAGRIDVVDR